MCIVTGPNIDMPTKLIRLMKAISERNLDLTFSGKVAVLELNGHPIEAFPSNPIDSFPASNNPRFILPNVFDLS
jgi:hypothetical protein